MGEKIKNMFRGHKEKKKNQKYSSPEANDRTAKPLYHLSGQMLRHTDLKPGYNPQIGNLSLIHI